MTVFKITLYIMLTLFGVFLFFFGGYDDSPGAQGLGLLFFLSGIIKIIRSKKKTI